VQAAIVCAITPVLGVEGFDDAREGFLLPLPEAEFVAGGEKDIAHAELRCVGLGPCFALG